MAREHQEELFKEFKKEKGNIEKIADKITGQRRRLYIQAPLENIVFAVILVLICVIMAFAFGVERGKRLVSPPAPIEGTSFEAEITAPQIELKPIDVGSPAAKSEKPYTIQLIAYKKERLAEKEKAKLADKNIKAFIVPSGRWYQLCAGRYRNMGEAEKALEGFSKKYKGCFIRRR